MLSDFLTDERIVRLLILQRCKFADQRAKQMQVIEFVGDTKLKTLDEEKQSIYALFPSRSKWCRVGKRRIDMDSSQRNAFMLYATYCKAKKCKSQEEWFRRLQDKIAYIRYLALHPGIAMESPKVQMLFKKTESDNVVICRPVCKFDLDVRIVLSIYNKFLTEVLDEEFMDYSFAFRKPKGDTQFQHLEAVKSLTKYRKEHLGQMLYVSECDMQKFYDTLDHNIIKARFNMLMARVKKKGIITNTDYKCAKRWFYNYIDCFDFYNDVFSYNSKVDASAWDSVRKQYKGKKYEVKWVDALELEKKKKPYKRKGIPQGGALSGLIANIMMHYVDLSIHEVIANNDVAYLRFCDDMILVTPSESLSSKVLKVYNARLMSSRLHPHPVKDIHINHMKDFWDGKSRGPYKWGEHGKDVFPWITFVGFDVNWRGEVRVRKKSYQKQLTKQHTVVWDLLNQYKKGKTPKYCMNTIMESLRNRLIGMSVGRVTLWNYQKYENVHCWLAAFPLLDKNKWTVAQLKGMDRHREKELYKAMKFLEGIECGKRSKNKEGVRRKDHYYGKAYSYYGQAFKEF